MKKLFLILFFSIFALQMQAQTVQIKDIPFSIPSDSEGWEGPEDISDTQQRLSNGKAYLDISYYESSEASNAGALVEEAFETHAGTGLSSKSRAEFGLMDDTEGLDFRYFKLHVLGKGEWIWTKVWQVKDTSKGTLYIFTAVYKGKEGATFRKNTKDLEAMLQSIELP